SLCSSTSSYRHPFPTRRSSDLIGMTIAQYMPGNLANIGLVHRAQYGGRKVRIGLLDCQQREGSASAGIVPFAETVSKLQLYLRIDRKSTRLNSSHGSI